MAFIGNTVQTQGFIPATDTFSGNGSTTAFTLSRPVASVQQVFAVISNVDQDPNTAYTVSGNTITFTSAPPSGTNNIYVRYTSLITQVIAPSQGTVGNTQFANNVSAIPMPYGTIGAGNASIMKNRIINGAMVILQRGTSFSFATGSGNYYYGADRFATQDYTWSSGSNITVSNDTTVYPTGFRNSYKYATGATGLTLASGGVQFIRQAIEGYNIADCYTGNVTISFWVRSSTAGQYNIMLTNNSSSFEKYTTRNYTINSANTWEQKSITVDLSTGTSSGTWNTTNGEGLSLNFMLGANANRTGNDGLNTWATGGSPSYAWQTTGSVQLATIANSTFYITGVQLEVGSSATGYEYVNYQTSLANCQRYAYRVGADATAVYARFCAGFNDSNGSMNGCMHFPVSMRTAPSLTTTGTASNYTINSGNSSIFTATSVPVVAANATTVTTANIGTNASGLTAGQGALLIANNNSSAYLLFTAEL